MTDKRHSGKPFQLGDKVRYTRSGAAATQAPAGVVGVVRDVEHEQSILVEWPMGLASEYPHHIRHAR